MPAEGTAIDLFQDAVEPVRYEQHLIQAVAEQVWTHGAGGRPYHITVGRNDTGRPVRYLADGEGFCDGLDTVWQTGDGRWFGRWREASEPQGTFRTRMAPLAPADVRRLLEEVHLLPAGAEPS